MATTKSRFPEAPSRAEHASLELEGSQEATLSSCCRLSAAPLDFQAAWSAEWGTQSAAPLSSPSSWRAGRSVPFRMFPRAAETWNECCALCPLPVEQALLRTVPVAELNRQSLSQIGRAGHSLEAAAVGNGISLVQMVCSSKFIMEF